MITIYHLLILKNSSDYRGFTVIEYKFQNCFLQQICRSKFIFDSVIINIRHINFGDIVNQNLVLGLDTKVAQDCRTSLIELAQGCHTQAFWLNIRCAERLSLLVQHKHSRSCQRQKEEREESKSHLFCPCRALVMRKWTHLSQPFFDDFFNVKSVIVKEFLLYLKSSKWFMEWLEMDYGNGVFLPRTVTQT